MTTQCKLALVLFGFSALSVCATTHYVWQSSPGPAPPYTNWATAARNIQDAVDAAVAGDEIVVTNGTYATGGRRTNRVAVDKALSMRSVTGPQFTIIQGYQVPGITNGDGAIRCVYLTGGAALSGFTLTNGATRSFLDPNSEREASGGGVWCESATAVLSNCVVAGNSAYAYGGGAYGGTLNNCTLTGNSADCGGGVVGSTLNNCTLTGNSTTIGPGGGAWGGTLNNCTLTGNSAYKGGGAGFCVLSNCTLTANWAYEGGGAYYSTLSNCTLTANWAHEGGGAAACTLSNCTLSGNSASYGGGIGPDEGDNPSMLYNCTLTGNSAYDGGGAYGGTLNNCTVTGNSGWGVLSATLNNCIVYFNSDPNGGNYDSSSRLNYCCTTPMPTNGVGNIAADPQLASATHLSSTSPCIGAGRASYATGLDIDGEPWANPPCIGADQLILGGATGGITVGIGVDYGNVAVGFVVPLLAEVEGRLLRSVWDFGDGTSATNQPYTSHAWASPGVCTVRLTAYNDSHPEGVTTTRMIHVWARDAVLVYYVNQNNPNPVFPYMSWASAATNIQVAINAVVPGSVGGVVLVTNGTYAPVEVDKPVTVRSINGPGVTVINGGGTVQCLCLTNNATFVGFTLTNGRASYGGGGVYCQSTSAVLSNCVLTGNSAGGRPDPDSEGWNPGPVVGPMAAR